MRSLKSRWCRPLEYLMKNRQRPHVAESARPDFVTYMQIVTFCVLLILAGCGKSADDLATVGAVQRVIVTDASLHVQYMAELKAAYERYSAPFKDPSIKPMCAYSDRLEGIDLRGCPPQFQEAFISWCQSRTMASPEHLGACLNWLRRTQIPTSISKPKRQ
jgi:hypothetical protein